MTTPVALPAPRKGMTTVIAAAPEGVDALLLAGYAVAAARPLLFIARDDADAERMAGLLDFINPDLRVMQFPAWDCLPYDRVSPNPRITAARLRLLCHLARGGPVDIVITTVNALLQRLPPRETLAEAGFPLTAGEIADLDALSAFLHRNGYRRAATVREEGEYAIRGGITDIFPAGADAPLRLDFFGDALDAIRSFDPLTQLSAGMLDAALLIPVSEVPLGETEAALFRRRYRASFGAVAGDEDPLYEAVSERRRYPGMEHWLPLFHDRLETLFEYLPEATLFLAPQTGETADARLGDIATYYQARQERFAGTETGGKRKGAADAVPYKPLPPDALHLTPAEWQERLSRHAGYIFHPSDLPDSSAGPVFSARAQGVADFSTARADPAQDLFAAVAARLRGHGAARCLIAAATSGAAARLSALLEERGLFLPPPLTRWPDASTLAAGQIAPAVMELGRGFVFGDTVVYTETDILGERLSRPSRSRRRRSAELVTELSALQPSDLVVHEDHGIGRYEGLETLQVDGAPHDCLRLVYAGGDRLYVPVENLDLLSRFGSEDSTAQLDRLGAAAWQARKAMAKARIGEMARQLVGLAAQRQLRDGLVLTPPTGLYAEFTARFPYTETEDQQAAIDDVLADLASGRPMDRLVCGDVGFGKTEVAIRAAFVAAMNGVQVAVVVPTTLLARQHHRNFSDRMHGLPLRVAQLSRLVSAAEAGRVRKELADGVIDIVVGTHALLGKSVHFARLGLLVVDEEQHFGVAQKEQLKNLKQDVHVLTMTATPIPRTLQMALAGVRALSLIATPPVDRLAVRSFVLPYDPVIIREAILREHQRGGQSYCVCPRIADLDRMREKLAALTPEIRIAVAHGGMAAADLDRIMTEFTDGRYDLLLSTSIIESGLDIPNVNTMIVHRADMFGLAQLYQLRGRIGRGKLRAYCYLTLPPGQLLTGVAEKRLDAMRTLDSLGAGFTLASHDMDIRGAGNLLGEEQSGHIREVGVELYQRMLEEAMTAARGAAENPGGEDGAGTAEHWSPVISLGVAVLLPESYVPELGVRMELYRRLSRLEDQRGLDSFAVELADRFGPLPAAADTLLKVVGIKQFCRQAGVAALKAGPKGAVITFRNNSFANPSGLVGFIQRAAGSARLRPDHSLIITREWEGAASRLAGAAELARELARIARPR